MNESSPATTIALLRLEVVCSPPGAAQVQRACEFTRDGGTLGRSWRNDWMLPDLARLVSRRHARIVHGVAGMAGFGIVDLSRNGIWIDDESDPIGPDRIRPLHEGQRIRLCRRGQYLLRVVQTRMVPADAQADRRLGGIRPGGLA